MNGFFWAKRYLFKQKRRTFLTAFGIALAIALVCGTCVLADSFRMMMVNAQVLASGDWHYDVSGIDSWEDARTLIANRAFESGAVYSNDLYARFSGAGSVSEQNYSTEAPSTDYFLRIYEGDSDYVAMSSIEYNMQAGRLPESADEIALSISARRKFENAPSLGDTITLPVGALDYQEDSYNSDDDTYTFTQTGTRTYTVVGFVDVTTSPQRAFFAFSLPDGGAHSLTARVKLRSLTSDYRAAVENAVEQAGLAGKVSIDDNYGLIMYNVQGMDSAVQSSLIITCALLISIILGMMMMVVRNTFAISVDEKLQQFGILRCLGASRKSIRSIVGCEAFITWGIAAPVGVAGTIVAMQVIFAVIRTIDSELLSMLTLHWAAWPFALALSVSLICVLLAAASPARKCAKVSPMGAVRGEASLRQDIKKARGGWFTKRVFGFAGLMSARSMRRNPRKYRATLLSVTCSIAFFMLINGFTSGMRASLSMYASASNMDVTVSAEQDADSDGQVLKKLKAIDSAKDIARMLTIPVRLNVADSAFTDEVVQLYDDVSSAKYANLRFIGESEFRQLTFDGRAPSYEEFCQPGAAVVMQKLVLAGSRSGLKLYETMKLQPGDRLPVELNSASGAETAVSYNVAGTLKALPWYCSNTGSIVIFASDRNVPAGANAYCTYALRAQDGRAAELCKAITELSYTGGMSKWTVETIYLYMRENRALLQVMDIFLYGFTAVIMLICAMNLLNTIKTNLSSRKREICMLRALGMSRKQMIHMLSLECLWYAVLGTILGLILGLPLETLLITSMSGALPSELDFTMLGIQCALCFVAACAIALLAGMREILKIANLPASEGIRAIE